MSAGLAAQRQAKLNHVILAVVSVFLVSSIYLGIDWFLFWAFLGSRLPRVRH